ncbi:MAG: redoxin domain-containing protein [Bacteroidetes bacterium]|nr:redoxin domain-containing protein [Bacteroidota bacterium]
MTLKKRTFVLAFICFLFVSAGAQIQVGETAPDFTINDTEGHMHNLSEYTSAGQYVMLDFFFTTCVPCQYYTPQISMAYETYGCNQGDIVVLGIDYGDTDPEVIQYELTYGGLYPSVSGIDGGGNAVVADYGIIGFPFVCLIDPSNIVVEIFDPPTMQVFNYYFPLYGIEEMACVTGIAEPTSDIALNIYPNPANSFIHIDAQPGMIVSIYNTMGECMDQFTLENKSTIYYLSEYSGGIYFLKAIKGDQSAEYIFTVSE